MKNYTTFKFPYLLIEDLKGKFQPMFKEYTKEIPAIRMNSPALCCPFSDARRTNGIKKKPTVVPGYCEVCYCKFDNYEEHVSGKEHKEFALYDFNYRNIDIFIKDMLEQELYGCYNYNNSPCEKLEAKYSEVKHIYFTQSDEVDNLIRLSRGSEDNSDETVDFDIILNKINKMDAPKGK